jgi:hypothetical protein
MGFSGREFVATQIMAGFAADSHSAGVSIERLASDAVKWADALIKELGK